MAAGDPQRRVSIIQWRNWSLTVKLAAVALVPAVFAVSLGITQIQWQVGQASEYRRVTQVIDALGQVEPLISGVQSERTSAVQLLTGSGDRDSYERQSGTVDSSMLVVKQTLADQAPLDPVVQDRYRELRIAVDGLPVLRQQVRTGKTDSAAAIQAYSGTVTDLLSLDRALASTVADRSLSSSATALQNLDSSLEEVRLQQAWALTGLNPRGLSPQATETLLGSRARLLSKITEARSTLSSGWQQRLDTQLTSPEVLTRNQVLTQIIGASNDRSDRIPVSPGELNAITEHSVNIFNLAHRDLSNEVRQHAFELEDKASNAAGRDSVFLSTALILAAFSVLTISRQLLRSLRELRRSAMNSAERDLPAAVASIRAGDDVDTTIAPVKVDTTEEIGQVARAFDEVNRQALRLAAEQATLRHGYSESFVNVSRRSQSLLERQLRLFEELEHDEQDPDQLSRLFQLDHLATRMRRNNENLMVLAGSDLARRFTEPTNLADVLRAAVSEIEQYPRVVVQTPPEVQLVAHTASDLVRLVAELLDNAASFSAPETMVTVSSYQTGDGTITIDVLDEGIGMGDGELAEANARLSSTDEADLASSRRMGLFVVGRLAARRDIAVKLHGGPDVEGVRATVYVPVDHISSESQVRTEIPPAAQPGTRNGVSHDLPTAAGFPLQDADFDARVSAHDSPAALGFYTAQESAAAEQFDHNDAPTASLFTPMDIPEQSSMPEDFSFNWPAEAAEQPQPEEDPAPSPIFEEISTEWFQPSSENTTFQAAAESPGAREWPEDGNDFVQSQNPPSMHWNQPIVYAAGGAAQDPGGMSQQDDEDHGDFGGLPQRTPQAPASYSWEDNGNSSGLPPQFSPASPVSGDEDRGYSSGLPQRVPHASTTSENGGLPQRVPQASLTGSEDDGLPQRVPRASLSSEDDHSDSEGQRRSPQEIRRRLTEMQGGVHFGSDADQERRASQDTQSNTGWSFATDEATKQVEAAMKQDPSEYTSAGLPRRTPKAHLAPGSAPASSQPTGRYKRDADQLRGRLSSFQSGVRRGRHHAPDED